MSGLLTPNPVYKPFRYPWAYDAAYLELANRRTLPLATLDRNLAAAASTPGVRVMGQGA